MTEASILPHLDPGQPIVPGSLLFVDVEEEFNWNADRPTPRERADEVAAAISRELLDKGVVCSVYQANGYEDPGLFFGSTYSMSIVLRVNSYIEDDWTFDAPVQQAGAGGFVIAALIGAAVGLVVGSAVVVAIDWDVPAVASEVSDTARSVSRAVIVAALAGVVIYSINRLP